MASWVQRLTAVREDRTGKNDRLVRRLITGGELAIDLRLGGRGARHSRPIAAEVVDVSLTGLLVRVTGNLTIQPDSRVTLGEGTELAVCRVAHARARPDSIEQELGLQIVEMTDTFRDELHSVVAALRKDRGQFKLAWETSH